MEDQGKRLLLAVMAAFAVMMLWNLLFPPEPPLKEETPPSETSDTAGGEQKNAPTTPSGPASTPSGPASEKPIALAEAEAVTPQPIQRGQEQLFTFDFPLFRATFTSYGAKLKSWELQGDKYQTTGEDGSTRQIDMVALSDEQFLPFGVHFTDAPWPAETEWRGEKKSDTEVSFTWTYRVQDETGASVDAFELVKTYKLYPDDYLMELAVDVVNKASANEKQSLVVSLYGFQDPTKVKSSGWTRVDSSWKSVCDINDEVTTSDIGSLTKEKKKLRTGKVQWGGFLHSYFLVAAAPHVETSTDLGCNSYAVEGKTGVMQTDIVFPMMNIRRGGPPATNILVAYLGPKYLDKLESIPGVIGFDPDLSASIDLGWFWFLARPLLWALQWFHSFLGNWGLSIIILTILVKLATLPWTNKSMKSMKKMAKLKPQIDAINKKYKDDRQRQQTELMNLYKAHSINPMSGCLPMFLQMPIWFALYRMLMTAAELYHAPFIPGWINDLTSPDPYYVLPVGLVIMMFVQAKLSPTTGDSAQQKVMTYGLPIMFGGFSFFFPSGLTLYISTNTILTAAHHLWTNRNDPSRKNVPNSGAKGGKDVAVPAASVDAVPDESQSEAEVGKASKASRGSAAAAPGGGKASKSGTRAQRRGGKGKRGGGKS